MLQTRWPSLYSHCIEKALNPLFLSTFPIFRGLKLWCAGICFLSLAGKAISKVRDKRRHDVKIKIPLSYLWFKAEVGQLCHTGPTQPTSRRGRWCKYWVTAMLHEGDEQSWHPRHKASHLQEQIHHPLPLLQASLTVSSTRVLRKRTAMCHTQVQAWFCYWLWSMIISHSQLNLTKSRRSAK